MFDTWQELLVGYAAVVTVLGFVFVFLKRGGKIKAGNVSVGSGAAEAGSTQPAHATCMHVNDILSVIARTSEYVQNKTFSTNVLVGIQMKFVEEKEFEFRGKMQKVFISAVADKLNVHDGVIDHPEYKTYKLIMNDIKTVIIDYMRIVMRQNHLAEKTGEEWRDYKKRKYDAIQQIGTEMFNDLWFGQLITREELYRIHLNKGMSTLLNAFLDEALEFARDEALKMWDGLEKSKENYESFLKNRVLGDAFPQDA